MSLITEKHTNEKASKEKEKEPAQYKDLWYCEKCGCVNSSMDNVCKKCGRLKSKIMI
jgi:rubrerythrin